MYTNIHYILFYIKISRMLKYEISMVYDSVANHAFCISNIFNVYSAFRYERMYMSTCEVGDTPFHV